MAETALIVDPKSVAALLVRDQAQKALGRAPMKAQARPMQIFLEEPSDKPSAPMVLILSSTGKGNVPDQHLLPTTRYSRIFWFPESLPVHDHELPTYDIVFNAVGDVDAAPEAHALAAQFTQQCKRPMLNQPARVGQYIARRRGGFAARLRGRGHSKGAKNHPPGHRLDAGRLCRPELSADRAAHRRTWRRRCCPGRAPRTVPVAGSGCAGHLCDGIFRLSFAGQLVSQVSRDLH